ncbi:MAG: protease modulator HflC [bacterium]|nr:protease modulator HflC [bacterium]
MKKIVTLIIFVLAITVVSSSFFIVNETEQVVITRFGKPVRNIIKSAGIYFKIPLVEKANIFEKRILEWDGHVDVSEPFLTKDKKSIIVDTTARWRIKEPLQFLQAFHAEDRAQSRLDDIIDSNVRNVIQKMELIEVVRNSNRVLTVIHEENMNDEAALMQDIEEVAQQIHLGRDKITRMILEQSRKDMETWGVELIDVRIKGLIYSQSVLENVFNRMISQYGIKAQNLLSNGDRRRSEIEGKTELEVKQIRSEAYKNAQEIRGHGDATAAKIYAETLTIDPEFYHFQRSLDAYGKAIDKNSTLILGTESEFFRVLKKGDL